MRDNTKFKNDPIGSNWRKWDLHVHTKGTAKNDQFTSADFDIFCSILFKKSLENKIAAIGITDYFSVENYKKVKNYLSKIDENEDFSDEEKALIKQILILPNVELRMLPVTDKGKLVNIHCIFNPSFVDSLENDFFALIKHSGDTGKDYLMNRKGMIDLGKSLDSSLEEEAAYKKGVDNFVVYHGELKKLLENNSNFRENVIIVVSNSNRDGASGFQKHYDLFEDSDPSSLDAVRKSIYCISQAVFSGNEGDIIYFLGKKKDNEDEVKNKCGTLKPCIHGSDAHTEDKLFLPDKGRFCWIKADPTFEGLKQIIYEPESGERVKIGQIEPDQKDVYKVISNIRFSNTSDFPGEIKFNRNLCSIIGSRSSGKSALLAYVAHSVDAGLTEKMIKGPGEGDEYHWDKIIKSEFKYSIEWSNGQSNKESPGKIVYIHQDYLFDKSKDPDEIKAKIKPVLFKVLPDFKVKYIQAENNIEILNKKIEEQVDNWFGLSDDYTSIDEQLKDLGNKEAIQKEIEEIETKIKNLKDTDQLSNEELEQYQKASADISGFESKIEKTTTELRKLSDVSEVNKYFSGIEITLSPALASLPQKLQDKIMKGLKKTEDGILEEVNKQVVEYKKSIEEEKTDAEGKNKQIREDNKEVMVKYQGNVELEGLVNKINEYNDVLKNIESIETEKKNIQDRSDSCVKTIKSNLDIRKSIIEDLVTNIQSADQSILEDIQFGVEFGVENRLKEITQKINTKVNTEFVDKGQLKFDDIRRKTGEFLLAIYSEQQKVIAGNDKKRIASDTLSLTEEILFTAEMEGDKIGGFSEPTMTAGKRALFALKLILAESEDTWPLLIDQPEDDLDSRSIYDDVVPFLKTKKKERQIIMVSHNANLVIGADSEQIIVANRHGTDRENADEKQFNYLTGSLEFSKIRDKDCKDTLLSQGIREHSCEILDGGKPAFELRKNKYNI